MTHEGPPLAQLLHRMTECPPEFLLPPATATGRGEIDVAAIAGDCLRQLNARLPTDAALLALHSDRTPQQQTLVAVAAWLLADASMPTTLAVTNGAWTVLRETTLALSQFLTPDAVLRDADRREEFVRSCLAALDLRPAGESVEQARDRLTTLDSGERIRVVEQTRAAEERARAIRKKLADEAARAAATRYSPE